LGKRVWEKDIDAVGVLFFCDCCVFLGCGLDDGVLGMQGGLLDDEGGECRLREIVGGPLPYILQVR
jgi:hypothetical protein